MNDEDLAGDGMPSLSELADERPSFDRREVIAGIAAGAIAAVSRANAGEPVRPNIRLIRNPSRHNEFGVAIEYTPAEAAASTEERLAVAIYSRMFGSAGLPKAQRWSVQEKKSIDAVQDIDRFAFEDVTFSDRGKYALEFTVERSDDPKNWQISAAFNRLGQRDKSKAEAVGLLDFARGKVGLQFFLDFRRAESFRWDLFGERLEIGKGGAWLTLFLAPPEHPPRYSEWIEPELRMTLVPAAKSTIWAFRNAILVNKLEIKRTQGDQGDGAHIQEQQERVGLERTKRYRSLAWLGEATELSWNVPDVPQQAPPIRYQIGEQKTSRTKPALEVFQQAPPTKFAIRQWGSARNTLAMLRAPLNVNILGPGASASQSRIARETSRPDASADKAPRPALFLLADAILTKQDLNSNEARKPGDVKDESIEETLTGRLQDKPFVVDTPYGSLIVEGDPPPKKAPSKSDAAADGKAKAGKQAERSKATTTPPPDRKADGKKVDDKNADDKNPLGRPLDRRDDFAFQPAKGLTQFHLRARDNEIRFFDARALLRQITTSLPNEPAKHNNIKEDAALWSRLDFDGTEIAFRLNLPGTAQRWPSARGIVTLGELPRGLEPLAKASVDRAGWTIPPPIWIALDGARLEVRRDSDNLALSFHFVRMSLELGKDHGRIVPNLRLSGAGAGRTAFLETGERKFDDRPLLIVHFPPQHVAERVYFRQVNDGITLPDVLGGLEGDKGFATRLQEWRSTPASDGKKAEIRKRLFVEQRDKINELPESDPLHGQVKQSRIKELFELLDNDGKADKWLDKVGPESAKLLERWNGLPQDQRAYYLGISANAMDPDVRKLWLDIWRAYHAQRLTVRSDDPGFKDAFTEALQILPDPDIFDNVRNDLKLRLSDASGKFDDAKLQEALTIEKRKRSDDFVAVWKLYSSYPEEGSPGQDLKGKKPRPKILPSVYSGREAIENVWNGLGPGHQDKKKILEFVQALARIYQTEVQYEQFQSVTAARLSGPSRLVFRFDSAGGSFDDRDFGKRSDRGEEKEEVRSIHFSLEGLTDWGRFDLAVTRRAETLEMLPGGRVPHPDLRAIDLDASRILAHQGIRPGRSIEGRLADIQAALGPPAQDETAIELPFRLLLSPDQFGRFRTRRPIEKGVLRPGLDEAPAERLKILPVLWSANLQVGEASPVVRAVWSDDFRPGAFDGSAAPERGPDAPWQNAPEPGFKPAQFRTALDAYDRHEIVGLSSVYGLPVMGRRNEYDSLIDASQFEPPKNYKLDRLRLYQNASKKPADLSGIYNPASLNISELRLTALGGSLRHDSSFTPPAAATLARGGNLFEAFSVERWRQITVLGRDIEVEVVYKGFLFPLGVRATLVKLTERRFIRHGDKGPITAFLIQRKFIRIGKPTKSFPAIGQPDAARRFPLSELTMLTRETPDIVDPDLYGSPVPEQFKASSKDLWLGLHPNGKLDFSTARPADKTNRLAGLCFWPRTRPGEGGNISFEFRIEGDATPLRLPLVFVDNKAANSPAAMAALSAYYNWDVKGNAPANVSALGRVKHLRTVEMGGAKRRYADENQDGECQFETFRWEIKAEGRQELVKPDGTPAPAVDGQISTVDNSYFEFDPLLQGSDQPPFYPYVDRANIRIGQAERFVGRALPPRDVFFNPIYRTGGFPKAEDAKFDPASRPLRSRYYVRYLERYLELAEVLPLGMGDSGDRSGGIGRPAMEVKYLSRRYGLMPESLIVPVDNAAAQNAPSTNGEPKPDDVASEPPSPPFDLKGFFKGDAKLLGVISFEDLLGAAGSAMPELKEKVDAATEDTAEFLRQTVLPEIERALKSLEEMWQAARKALTSQSGATRDVVSLDINKIYPDIAPALTGLLDKVDRAKKASSNLELVNAMSQVQASGRKLVTAISRTLADPIAPLREELRGKFRVLSQQIHDFGTGLGAIAAAAIDTLKERLRKEIEAELQEEIPSIKPFMRLVLSLPIPDPLPDLGDVPTRKEIADHLDTALAHGAIAFIGVVLSNELSAQTMQTALHKGLGVANEKLKPEALPPAAQKAVAAYKKQASALLDSLKNASGAAQEKARQELLRQVPGILHPLLFGEKGIVTVLAFDAAELRGEITQGGRDVLAIAARRLAHALKTIETALVQQQATALCKDLAGKFAQLANRMLLPAEATPERPRSITTVMKSLANLVAAVWPSGSADDASAKEVVERYKQIRKYITDDMVADACVADSPKNALQAVVIKEVRELQKLKHAINEHILTSVTNCEAELKKLADGVTSGQGGFPGAGRALVDAFRRPDIIKLQQEFTDQLADFVGASTDKARATLKDLQDSIKGLKDAVPTSPDKTSPINRAVAAQLDQMLASIEDVRGALQTVRDMFERAKATGQSPDKTALDAARMLIVVLKGTAASTEEKFKQSRETLEKDVDKQIQVVRDGALKTIDEAEGRLMSLLGEVLLAGDAAKDAAVKVIGRVAAPIFSVIQKEIYKRIDTLRDEGRAVLARGDDASTVEKILQELLKRLRGPDGQLLEGMFSVGPTAKSNGVDLDRIDQDIALLDRLISVSDPKTYVSDLATFAEGWETGNASPLVLLRNLGYLLTAVLKGDLAQFVDLHQIRREVDQAIRAMVPARIRRSYDLKLRLKDVGNLVMFTGAKENARRAGLPKPHPKGLPETLVLRATGVVDVLQPEKSTFEAEGYLPGFALQLLPSFDVVTFSFPPTSFTAGLGKPFRISLKVDDVQLGKKVEFLKKIESILPAPKNGKGFFVRMMRGRGGLGIVAGYALPISPITIGNMYIDGLSLNAAAELPFDNGDARFVISVSRPEAPFMIAAAPYAGAGHFGLIANSKGIIGFEASFQFGGGGGFSFGPLTGKGRISVGIFIRKISGLTELYGLFYAGGSARIACFSVGAQLNVRMSQNGGNCEGEATFTYSFSIGIKDIEFSVTVFKREKGSGEGQDSKDKREVKASGAKTIDLASHEFREVFAQAPGKSKQPGLARLENRTYCKGENFAAYLGYFSKRPVLAPVRTNSRSAAPKAKGSKAASSTAAKSNASAKPSIWIMS